MTRRLFFGKELGQATLTSEKKKKPAWGLFFYIFIGQTLGLSYQAYNTLPHSSLFFLILFFKKNYYFLHVFLKITFAFMF
jgi:hypothetical protein